MYKELNKVFSMIQTELKSEKVELEKVELALVDDAKKIINSIKGELGDIEERAFDFVVDAEMTYKKAISSYKDQLKKINSISPKLDKAIKEIGINRSTFGVLDDLDESRNRIEERIKISQKNIDKLKGIRIN